MKSTNASSATTNIAKTASGYTTAPTPLEIGEKEKTPLLFGKTKLQIWRNNRVLAPYISSYRDVSDDWFKIFNKHITLKKSISLAHRQGHSCYNSIVKKTDRFTHFVYLFNGLACFELGFFGFETANTFWYDIFRDPIWLSKEGEKKEKLFTEMFRENNVFLFHKFVREEFIHLEKRGWRLKNYLNY